MLCCNNLGLRMEHFCYLSSAGREISGCCIAKLWTVLADYVDLGELKSLHEAACSCAGASELSRGVAALAILWRGL